MRKKLFFGLLRNRGSLNKIGKPVPVRETVTTVGTGFMKLCLMGCCCLGLTMTGSVRGREVLLVEGGVPRMRILAATVGDPAAVELRRVLRKISGAELEIAAAEPGQEGIYVGKASDFPWTIPEEDAVDGGVEDGLVRSDGTNLLLLGNGEKGARHAVMTFLHELGCRWFFPGEAWEVLPERATLRGSWNLRFSPSFNIQRRLGYGFGAYRGNAEDKQAWDFHNRLGGAIRVSIGHAGHGLTREDFERNPGLFAMRKGERVFGSKPCYSHPEYIRRATERVLKQAEAGATMISMTPADGLGYCECPRCHEWARGGEVFWDKGSQFAKRPDGTLVCITSESLFHCINIAARALREQYPEATIGTYAYSAYSHPPSFPIEPNVFVQTTTSYRRTPMSLREQLETFRSMGVRSGIRGYWSVYQWDWDLPVVKGELALPRLAEDIRFYHRNNVRSLNTEMSCNWGPRGLGYYVGARLLWNVEEDVRALVAEFYTLAFGPAADAMERYYVRWLGEGARGNLPPAKIETVPDAPGDGAREGVAFTRETLKAACADLEEAARRVKDWPEYRARVDLLRMYAHYLGLRFRVEDAAETGDKAAVVEAVRNETVFGARIMKTNMIHTRPLIGKAFHRRFRAYKSCLEGLPEWPANPKNGWNVGFRSVRDDVPAQEELETLWAQDKAFLGF